MVRRGRSRRWRYGGACCGLGWVIGACQVGDERPNDRTERPIVEASFVASRGTTRGRSGRLAFELELHPPRPAMGQIFRVTTVVSDPRSGQPLERGTLRLDAIMPDHGHGMETRPVHRSIGDGRFLSEGMKLHMPGLWHFGVEARGELNGQEVEDGAVLLFRQPIVVR